MADALVSGLVRTVLGNLNSVGVQEICLSWGLKNELNSLESILDTIQLVLQDAELKQRKSEAVTNWLRKLKNAAYDAENILDQIATESLRRSLDSERGKHHKLNAFMSLRNPILFRFKVAHKVKNVKERLDAIAEERLKFHLREGIIDNNQVVGYLVENRQTSSLVNESEIYGRHEEKEIIIQKLLESRHDQHYLPVYAICGMGGIGKTTLAQLVYNDERVDRHFELQIWVCVSDDFSIHRLVRAIIESIGGGGSNISELDPLQRLLKERLRGRRFLLVLDDVWNENYLLWEGLKEALTCGSKGSVLMVTTRIEKVAMMMATISVHHLRFLSEDDSWSLFKKRAFATGVDEDENLIEIGKGIVRKCGGVPLAVKSLGSLMRYTSSESEWLAIKESEIWHLSDDENGILPALRLSYDNLPLQMRQCFAYCCIFCKDDVMEENELIQLWMANGFIPSEEQTDLYLTGHLIFKELVWRSFFQDVKDNFRGNVACKMHDLMHDLAESVMRHETYIVEHGKVLIFPKTLHHLSFGWFPHQRISEVQLPINKSLRSLIVHDPRRALPVNVEGFSSFISMQLCLRVLSLNSHRIEKLPDFVWKMEHLRFLTMACQNLKRLPESLTCLHNLQTLNLIRSDELIELPKRLKYMKKLCFLHIESWLSLVCTPPRLKDLTCLQKLSIFIVGQDSAHQVDQLKDLNLGGDLTVRGLEHIRNFEGAKSANLMSKKNLTSLGLYWTKGINQDFAEHFEEVLEGLQPNRNLEKIRIRFYQGSRFPNWMSNLYFNNLKEIILEQCPRCVRLPPLGDVESSFSTLKNLTIRSMPNLVEWTIPDSLESFHCLVSLEIWDCPKLTGLPFLPNLKELMIVSDNNMSFLMSMMLLTSLTCLSLNGFSEIDVLPRGLFQNYNALVHLQISLSSIKTLSNTLDNLSALKSLCVSNCSNLEFIPEGLKHLNSLDSLDICSCDSLTSFPSIILEGSSSLRSLSISNCDKMIDILSGPLKKSPTLQVLEINGCPELKYLPENVQQLSGLRNLSIWDCERLCSLPSWLGSLQLLSEMSIRYCNNLNSLLRKIEIEECPILAKRCKKPKGEDWQKISHIS